MNHTQHTLMGTVALDCADHGPDCRCASGERRGASAIVDRRSDAGTLAEQTEVWLTGKGTPERLLKLVSQPVFRYSDQPRSILDAHAMGLDRRHRPADRRAEDRGFAISGRRRSAVDLLPGVTGNRDDSSSMVRGPGL